MAAQVTGSVTAGTKTRAGVLVSRAMRATARPWLPSVAVTKTSPGRWVAAVRNAARASGGAALGVTGSLAGEPVRSRWMAQEAPRTLKAGRTRRDDSSLTKTRPTPSSPASAGTSVSGVGA